MPKSTIGRLDITFTATLGRVREGDTWTCVRMPDSASSASADAGRAGGGARSWAAASGHRNAAGVQTRRRPA